MFEKNKATTGGGAAIQNLQLASMLDINGTALVGNSAPPRYDGMESEIDAMGGGLWVAGGSMLLTSIYLGNNTAAYGAGIAWALKPLSLETQRVTSLEIATDQALRDLLTCPSIAAA